MPILGRYILRTVLGYTVLALFVLLALGALFLFISEQDDIGTGSYAASQAMTFVLLNLPTFAGQLFTTAQLPGATFPARIALRSALDTPLEAAAT